MRPSGPMRKIELYPNPPRAQDPILRLARVFARQVERAAPSPRRPRASGYTKMNIARKARAATHMRGFTSATRPRTAMRMT